MKPTHVTVEELKTLWSTWSTQECQDEFDEMTAKLARIKGKLDKAAERPSSAHDPEWYGRTQRARRHLAVERDTLAKYLCERRKADRLEAHRLRELRRPWEHRFVGIAKRELPPEWYDYLRQLTDIEVDKAAEELAATLEAS